MKKRNVKNALAAFFFGNARGTGGVCPGVL